jgi:hypothetical protein
MNHWTPQQSAWLRRVVPFRVVQHGSAQPPDVFEKRLPGDTSVVDGHDPCSGVGGELLGVAVPRRPRGFVGVHQHQRVFRLDRCGVRSHAQRVEAVRPDEMRVERQRREIGCLHPTDREVEIAVGHAGRLCVRRHDPRVDTQLGHTGGPFCPVGRTPVHVADAHALGGHQTSRPPSKLVGLFHQCARMR